MSSALLAPLFTIPGPLLNELQTSYSYLATGCELLNGTLALESRLRRAFFSQPSPEGTDYFLDCHRMDLNEARRVFLEIRDLRKKVEEDYPLFQPPAAQLDYLAHMTINILPATEIKARKLATVGADGKSFSFEQADKKPFVHSVAAHFGISPEPLFGGALDLQAPGVVRGLAAYGFGLYAYLGYAVIPALGAAQCLSAELALEWQRRQPAPAKVARSENGSYFLDPR